MCFPNSIEKVNVVRIESDVLKRVLGHEVERLKEKQAFHQLLEKTLTELFKSWRHPEPGKWGESFFFLAPDRKSRLVVREFLAPDDVLIESQADQGLVHSVESCPGQWQDKKTYFVVPLAEVAYIECTKCRVPLPIIERTWGSIGQHKLDSELFALCPDCGCKTITDRSSG